eukprot:4770594-Pleurochrysis_carterae.AAC.1
METGMDYKLFTLLGCLPKSDMYAALNSCLVRPPFAPWSYCKNVDVTALRAVCSSTPSRPAAISVCRAFAYASENAAPSVQPSQLQPATLSAPPPLANIFRQRGNVTTWRNRSRLPPGPRPSPHATQRSERPRTRLLA